ncbi:hypothetical protein CONLIGDRAFT_687743 [Coniochaeta ligniaria NRRL 30616]|uniref:Uncharacterized protein n=1 Tax=Coniochaeta ligniaria NRRL 30616 TaxID=1408157 RepID=A0A1J7I4C7_9PEZI|nr:hypothetical protein CONLIGDRAFT_687743 [Coniochaeta ligniaria NRRL 30616]
MSQRGPLPKLLISVADHVVPDPAPAAPYVPSVLKAASYYYRFPSKLPLVARLPAVTFYPAPRLIESFSTSLSLSIYYAKTTHYEGTVGYFFADNADKEGTGAPQRKAMLMGKAASEALVEDINAAIRAKKINLAQLQKCAADKTIKAFEKLRADVL